MFQKTIKKYDIFLIKSFIKKNKYLTLQTLIETSDILENKN